MSGPVIPSIPMLSGGGSGKALMVIGVLVALAVVAKSQEPAVASVKAK